MTTQVEEASRVKLEDSLTLACRSRGHLWGFWWVAAEPGHRAVPLQDPVLRLETLTRNTEEGLFKRELPGITT